MSTKLDANQVIKAVYDETNQRLRTDSVVSGDIIISDININQEDDSIRLGDGTNLVTATTDGSRTGLDVNILNDIQLEIDAASGDNIAISDGTNTLSINPDGSLNVNVENSSATPITVLYNEVNSVASNVLTTIASYTASSNTVLKDISASGDNIATYEVVVNSEIVEKKRTYFGSPLNVDFQLDNLYLNMGDNVLIRVIHNRPFVGDFNVTIKLR